MSRVIIFSETFPKYHPHSGRETFFVEKIWASIFGENAIKHPRNHRKLFRIASKYYTAPEGFIPKLHTIRAGNHWKEGNIFSPRIWSGKPYKSKQISIGEDLEVVKVYDFEIRDKLVWVHKCFNQGKFLDEISKNDGFDFLRQLKQNMFTK